jgi:O-antigen/teichoic acid export membrane protein
MRARVTAAVSSLRGSDTSKAVGLAGAMIANNVVALISSVVFARMLNDYGALASLISYLLILTVFGQALQVATAREGVLGHLGTGEDLLHTLERWARALAIFTLAATVVSILLRVQIAQLVGVRHNSGGSWAAAIGIPAGCLYLGVSILRGALQGVGDYKSVGISLVGEQASRLITGAILVAAGLGVAGAYLGTLLSYVVMSTLLRHHALPPSRWPRSQALALRRRHPRKARPGAPRSRRRDPDPRSGSDPAAAERRFDRRQASLLQQDR